MSTLETYRFDSRLTAIQVLAVVSIALLLLALVVRPGLFVENLIGGVIYGLILALIALGLALILGLLGVVNFAHGGLFMLGAYGAYEVVAVLGLPFWIAFIAVPIAVGLIGVAMEASILRRLYGENPLIGLLATFGVFLMIEEAVRAKRGGTPLTFDTPTLLQGSVSVGIVQITMMRLFTVLVGSLVIVGIYLLMYRTDFGLTVRAGLQDKEMAGFIGIDIPARFTIVFFIGSAMAGLAGVLRGAETGMDLSMGFEYVLLAFVIVGGVGSIFGSVISALLIDVAVFIAPVVVGVLATTTGIDVFAVDGVGGLMPYVVMLVILLIRPRGFFGEEGLLE